MRARHGQVFGAVRCLALALVLLSGPLPPTDSAAAGDSCSCFRCGWTRQGVTLKVTSALKDFVTADVLELPGFGVTIESSPVVAPDGIVYVIAKTGILLAYERQSVPKTDFWDEAPAQYALLWRTPLKPELDGILSSPALAVGSAVSRPYILILASGQHVVAVDGSAPKSGFKQMWKQDLCVFAKDIFDQEGRTCDLNVVSSSPTVSPDGGTVYVCSGPMQGGACFGLATADGAKKWVHYSSFQSYVASPSLSPKGDLIYLASRQMRLFVLAANETSPLVVAGTGQARSFFIGGLSSTPAVADNGDIYLCEESGKLLKLDSTGQLLWRMPVNGSFCGKTVIQGCSTCHPDAMQATPAIIPAHLGDGGHVVVTGQDWVTRVINADGVVVRSICAHPLRNVSNSNPSCEGLVMGTDLLQTSFKVGSVTVTQDGVMLVPAANNYLLAFAFTTEWTEVWRYKIADSASPVNIGGGVAQAVWRAGGDAGGGELILASSDGRLHVLGKAPYLGERPRVNVEWSLANVAEATADALRADGAASLRTNLTGELRKQGINGVTEKHILLPSVTRSVARRAGTVTLVVALCVHLENAAVNSAPMVARHVEQPGPVLTAAQFVLGAASLTVTKAAGLTLVPHFPDGPFARVRVFLAGLDVRVWSLGPMVCVALSRAPTATVDAQRWIIYACWRRTLTCAPAGNEDDDNDDHVIDTCDQPDAMCRNAGHRGSAARDPAAAARPPSAAPAPAPAAPAAARHAAAGALGAVHDGRGMCQRHRVWSHLLHVFEAGCLHRCRKTQPAAAQQLADHHGCGVVRVFPRPGDAERVDIQVHR